MDKKTLKKVHVWVRAVIQLLYFLFIPSAYTAAFNGVKYIFTQMGAKSHLELTSFVVTLIALCLFTVVFGRFFCGFACAFGSLGDAVRAFYVFICKKRKKKPVTMKASVVKYLQAVKYIVLVLLVVSCYTGVYSLSLIHIYADGYRYFYCGMAMGFDLLAAEAALSLQCELKDLQVIAVVPFRGQSDRWSKEEQAKYDAILRIVDDVVVLSEQYYNGCLLRRNDYMVNRSSRLIAYFDGNPKGGTFYTVREAKRQGLDIVNLHNSV